MEEIQIKTWEQKKRLKFENFEFTNLVGNNIVYMSDNCKYRISTNLTEKSMLKNKETASAIFIQTVNFKLEKLY